MSLTTNQLRAITEPGNLLVVAAAGAGKTGTLVERCTRMLLRAEDPVGIRQILVVTFTEAAAAEVRDRIRRELEKAAAENPANEWIQDQLANLDSSYISTLHSFCFELVRKHVLQLGLDPAVSVLEPHHSRILFLNTLDLLLNEHYAGEHSFSGELKEVIRSHFGGWEKPLKTFVEKLHEFTQTRPAPERWFEQTLAALSQEKCPIWQQWYLDAVREWCEWWLPCLEALPATNSNGRACAELMRAALAVENPDTARIILDRDECWPANKKGEQRDGLENLFEEAEFLSSLIPEPGKTNPLEEDWEWMRKPLLTVLRFAKQFSERFTAEKSERGVVDFHDLEQFALRLLVDPSNGAPTEAARVWQERFQAVFVDEYQDINAAQDLIISALGSQTRPGNRFLVGDMKQSIYRFRQADPAIFQNYRERPGWTTILLSENFRSHEGILRFVNPLFSWLMKREFGGLVYEAEAQLRFGNPTGRSEMSAHEGTSPPIEVHLLALDKESRGDNDECEIEKPELEARLVAWRLRQLKENGFAIYDQRERSTRPVEWKDMVVLLRAARNRVEVYAKAFAEAGVPLQTKRDAFFTTPEVLDLCNILSILDNPRQDIPLAGVLRSPLVGLTADEIARVKVHSTRRPLWAALHEAFEGKAECGLVKIERFLRLYQQWRSSRRCSSLAQRLEAILSDTGYGDWLLSQPRGRERYANVQQLVRIARQFDESRGESLYLFLRHIEELEDAVGDIEPATSVEQNAVRLMTVHQSKGLEFPVVAVADLGKPFNNSDRTEGLLIHDRFGLCSMVKPPHTGRRYPSLPLWLARRSEHREAVGEEMRVLYVALTRAQNHLLLFGTASPRQLEKWHEPLTDPLLPQQILRQQSWLQWLGPFTFLDSVKDLFVRTVHDSVPKVEISREPAASRFEDASLPPEPAYKHEVATRTPAKTSVTTLRRMADTDEEAASLPTRVRREKNGAERGVAVHTFLEFLALESATLELALRTDAQRLIRAGLLTPEQAAQIDFDAISAFWQSQTGSELLRREREIRRELPFTFKARRKDLVAAGLGNSLMVPEDEFIVIQGVADLVLLGKSEIWLIDFKTDRLAPGELKTAAERYRAQLLLYSVALNAIYNRPVTKKGIFFLDARKFAWF